MTYHLMPDEAEPTWKGVAIEALGVIGLVVLWVTVQGAFQGMASVNSGLPLLLQTLALFIGTTVLMFLCRPVSGGHLNPLMTLIYGVSNRLPLGQAMAMSAAHLFGALLAMALVFMVLTEKQAGALNAAHLIGEWLAAILVVNVIIAVRNEGVIDASVCIAASMAAIYGLSGGATLVNPAVTLMQGIFGIGLNTTQAGPIMAAQFAGALTGLAVARFIWGGRFW
jgi:glycerol uptake facilitator-like aquaporin